MERNAAGGYAFALDDWTRLDRFLIIGSEVAADAAGRAPTSRETRRRPAGVALPR
jgi:60 kDa SS-A/Ro ribonucleoprotein